MRQRFNPAAETDHVLLHNMYMDALFRSSMLKHNLLSASMIRSVNAMDFLSYALAGRAFFELTATLRYCFKTRIKPVVDECVQSQMVDPSRLAALLQTEDQLLRGGSFDWVSFLCGEFDKLQSTPATSTTNPIGLKEEQQTSPKPIRIGDCIRHWSETLPFAGVLYGLFCDMVHPNVGSSLCIAIAEFDGISFNFPDYNQKTVGLTLFDKSYPLLQSLVADEFIKVVDAFLLLKIDKQP